MWQLEVKMNEKSLKYLENCFSKLPNFSVKFLEFELDLHFLTYSNYQPAKIINPSFNKHEEALCEKEVVCPKIPLLRTAFK